MGVLADSFRGVRLSLACACAALGLSVADGAAQTEGNQLRGAESFHLIIQTTNPSGDACGVTEERIREAFMFPASGAKFAIAEIAPLAIHIVSLGGDVKDGRCATHVKLLVYFYLTVEPRFAKAPFEGRVVVWDGDALSFSGRDDHPKEVREVVDALTRKFVTDWNMDNK
jgi:hypothetical protein